MHLAAGLVTWRPACLHREYHIHLPSLRSAAPPSTRPSLPLQVNYLGHYVLTRLLEDTLQASAPARVRRSPRRYLFHGVLRHLAEACPPPLLTGPSPS